MLNMSPEMIDGVKKDTDAFMAFSKIALSSVEQLTTLNLRTARSSLAAGTATAASILESKNGFSSKATQTQSLAATEGIAAYFRSVNSIASEACQETVKLMTHYFATLGPGSNHKAAWLQGFDAFKSFGQQFSTFTEANSTAIANITARVANQSTAHLKKSA